jgi:hypothetical protein
MTRENETDLKHMFFTNKKMATTQQLEKQKQDLVNTLNQIINEPKIPINDKVPILKELSRAIANISEQINKMIQTTTIPKDERRKVEIKEIRKEKKELEPLGIPDIIKVVKVDLNKVEYKKNVDDEAINWDSARPLIMDEIKAIMQSAKFKFPIVLQTSVKVVGVIQGKTEYEPIFRAARTDSVSNIKYVANNFEQVERVLRQQLDELLDKLEVTGEGSSYGSGWSHANGAQSMRLKNCRRIFCLHPKWM